MGREGRQAGGRRCLPGRRCLATQGMGWAVPLPHILQAMGHLTRAVAVRAPSSGPDGAGLVGPQASRDPSRTCPSPRLGPSQVRLPRTLPGQVCSLWSGLGFLLSPQALRPAPIFNQFNEILSSNS